MLSFNSRSSIRQLLQFMLPDIFPSAFCAPYFGLTAPLGWLLCDGTEFVISQHQNLFLAMVHNISVIGKGTKEGDFTADPATDELALGGHSFINGQLIHVDTDGTLPPPLTKDTVFYVRDVAAGIFKVAATLGGGAIDITGPGSGIHSVYPKFQVPDSRGRNLAGVDNLGGVSANRVLNAQADEVGGVVGAEFHTLVTGEMPAHFHIQTGGTISSGGNFAVKEGSGANVNSASQTTLVGNSNKHNNMQPTLFCGWIIKT